jgi:hypothetical protein
MNSERIKLCVKVIWYLMLNSIYQKYVERLMRTIYGTETVPKVESRFNVWLMKKECNSQYQLRRML